MAGPRQVGKSTLVQQVVEDLSMPVRFVSADEPTLRGTDWIAQQWEAARLAIDGPEGAVLVLDEVQKIPGWSETVKRLWDEDTRARRPLKSVLLGSAPLWITQGLTESLAGRFETLLTRVDKPALLRRLFELACRYSGQVLSYTKMLGQLQDAGNITTLAHYLELLAGAGMVCGLPKYAGDVARSRGSSPKLQVLNTALMTVLSGYTQDEARADREFRGRLVESAVGAHLASAAMRGECTLHYWRERNHEVDFIVKAGRRLTVIEVKSGRARRPIRAPLPSCRRSSRSARCWWAATASRCRTS